MRSPVALAETCCSEACDEIESIQIPGPAGAAGTNGEDGEDGLSPVTTTTAQFLMPAEGANVTVAVLDSSGIVIGSKMFVQTAGTMQVISKPTSASVTLQNLENTASGLYLDNAAPTTAIPTGSLMMPTGSQGASGVLTGAAGGHLKGTYPNPTIALNNAKGALLVGDGTNTIALTVGADDTIPHGESGVAAGIQYRAIDLTGANTALSGALPIGNGGTGQVTPTLAFNALSPQTTKGDITTDDGVTPVRLGIGADGTVFQADSAQFTGNKWAKILPANIDMASGPLPRYGLLGSLIGANFNVTTDQAIPIQTGISRYIIRRIIVDNASINLTTAAGGIYTNAGKAGVIIVAASQVYSALTASGKFKDLTLEAIVGTDVVVATTIYLSLSVAQGAAATANVWVFGENLTP